MNRTNHETSRTRRGLASLAMTGLLALGTTGVAFALPTQETTATPPGKTAPGATPTSAAPSAETPTPPPRTPPTGSTGSPTPTGSNPRGMPTPAAPTGNNLPPSPSAVLSERDVPGQTTAVTPLTGREAKKAEKIVRELHKTNELEVTLASLATARASSEAVKSYARELVDMHQAADKKVLSYAQSRGIAAGLVGLPTDASALPNMGTTTTTPGAAGSATGRVNGSGVASAGNSAINTTVPSATGASSATGHGTGLPAPNNPTIAGNTTRAADPNVDRAVPAATDAVAIPAPTLDAQGRQQLAKLEKLEGTAFDKQFLTMMVQGHSKALAKVKSFSKDKALDAELSLLLSETQTMVEGHLSRAKEIQRGGLSSVPGAEGAGTAAGARAVGAL
jgi:predicted outer membrane protein